MGFSLRKLLEEKWADVNVFDGGKSGATVRAARNKPLPARTPDENGNGLSVSVAQPQQQIQLAQPEQPKPQIKIDTQQFRQPTVTVAKPVPTPDVIMPDGRKLSEVPKTGEDYVNEGLDSGKSWEQISHELGIPVENVQSYSQATRPNYGVSIAKPQQSNGNKLRDIFDANTQADQYRRQEANREKIQIGGDRASEQAPIVSVDPGNLASNTIGAIPRMANTLANQSVEVGYTAQQQFATAEYSAATEEYTKAVASKNPQAIANAKYRLSGAAQRVDDINKMIEATKSNYKTNNGGLFNAGTLYNEEDSYSGDLETGLKKVGLGTAEGMLDAASLGITGASGKVIAKEVAEQGLKTGLKTGIKTQVPNIIKNAMINTTQGGVSAGRQGADWEGVLKSAAISGTVGTAADLGLAVVGGVAVPKLIQVAKGIPEMGEDGFVKIPGKLAANDVDNMTPLEITQKANVRPDAELQTKLEQAWNANDNKTAQSLIDQMSPDMKTSMQSIQDGRVSPPTKPPAAVTPEPGAALPGGKKSRFADKTVQASEEVSPEVQARVAEIQKATPTTSNAEHLAGSDAFLKKNTLLQAQTRIKSTLEKKLGTLTDQDVSDAIATAKALDGKSTKASIQAASEIYEQLSDHLKKNGQTIQAASLLNNRTPQGLIYGAEKALRKGGVELTDDIRTGIRDLVEQVKKAAPGSYEDGLARYKLMEFVSKHTPAGIADKGVQLWKAGLLSAPTTTGGNLLANSAEQIFKHGYKDPLSAGIDQVFSLFTGKRSKSLTWRGIASGTKEGAEKGVKYFKTGYDPRDPLQKFDIHDIHYSDTKAGKAAELYTQTIFRLMGSQDQPFYYASLRNSLYDQAITEAKNAGLKKQGRSEFIKKFITEPSDQAMQLADKEARYDVFQNPTALGNLASKVNKGALGQFIIPFSQVPSSVATRMIDRTPIGVAKEIVTQIKKGKFDQRAMVDSISNGSAGILFIGAGAALTKAGLLTTSYPTDQKERDLWDLEGKQPNSVRIGNTWVSLNYMQPMGTLFAAGANYQKAKDEGKSTTEAYTAAAAGASKALTEQSFLKGVSGGLNALADPQRASEKFAESTTGSIVPNFIRSGARSLDDKQRDQDGLFESFVAGVPYARESLPEKTDIFGQSLPRKTDAANSYFNPFRPSDVRQGDQTTGELRRLQDADEGVTATKILKDALGDGAPKLSSDQQLELKNEIGQRLKQDWDRVISDPNYAGMSDLDKRQKLEKVKGDITGAYKAKYGVEKNMMTPDPKKLSTNEKRILMSDDIDYFAGADKEKLNAEVDQFKESNDKSKEIGDRIYFRDKSGEVKSKSKFDYAADKEDAKIKLSMDRRKASGDLDGWLTDAESKYKLLESKKQQYDPSFESDEIDKITLAQENLLDEAAKYQEYGGFKKGSTSAKSKTKSKLGLDYSLFGLSNMLGTQKSLRQLLSEAKVGKA